MSLLLTSRQALTWWDDFNSRLAAPCSRPRIIVTLLPMRSEGRTVAALYRGGVVRLWRGLGGGPKAKWAAFHEYAHHLDDGLDWSGWGEEASMAWSRFAGAVLRRGADPGESFQCALAFLMLGRWHAGCPQVRNLAPMLKPLLKEER